MRWIKILLEVHNQTNTNVAVSQDVETSSRDRARRSAREDRVYPMGVGAELALVACEPRGTHPRPVGRVLDDGIQSGSTIE